MANISSSGLANYNNELKTTNSNFNLEKLQKWWFYLNPWSIIQTFKISSFVQNFLKPVKSLNFLICLIILDIVVIKYCKFNSWQFKKFLSETCGSDNDENNDITSNEKKNDDSNVI